MMVFTILGTVAELERSLCGTGEGGAFFSGATNPLSQHVRD
jgi:hypothetical protein